MHSSKHYNDEGIVLRKKFLLNNILRITVFSKNYGKIVLSTYGIKKINSRRLSHLETGNYIKFSYQEKDSFLSLKETEMMYGYSKIKASSDKLHTMYLIFYILNKILPEMQVESQIFTLTQDFLKKLNNKEIKKNDIDAYILKVFTLAGFVDEAESIAGIDSLDLAEKILGEKIKLG